LILAALFLVAAASGASLRAVASELANSEPFPYGTFAVNMVASLALGALSQAGQEWGTVLGLAGLGALSTWSAVANEVAGMARAQQGPMAVLYLIASCSSGVVAAWVGIQLAG
jgi:fluoride ion exporter CrcB/FEX